jgi:catechol 2,3-dioxygenase-like lactoylglutathione lyase family enzyme
MLDHVILNVSNYERSKEFYSAALGPLGLDPAEADGYCDYGTFYEVVDRCSETSA